MFVKVSSHSSLLVVSITSSVTTWKERIPSCGIPSAVKQSNLKGGKKLLRQGGVACFGTIWHSLGGLCEILFYKPVFSFRTDGNPSHPVKRRTNLMAGKPKELLQAGCPFAESEGQAASVKQTQLS